MSLQIVHEAMTMMRVIVTFGREGHEWLRFRRQGEQAVDARVNLTVRQTMFSLVVTMTTAIGSALVLGFGAYFVLEHKITAGELLVVIGLRRRAVRAARADQQHRQRPADAVHHPRAAR